MAYDEAIQRVAGEIERIQSQYGHDAFAVLGGASLTTEKAYLMGKFARMCLKTANIDYNGRLCMVSAAAAQQEGVRHRPGRQPVADILTAEVIWISGANIAECAPITTDYVWQAREHGAKIIVVDPRITPLARTVRPVPAGQARPRHRAVQRHPAPDDRERLARPRLHRATTPSGSRRSPSTCRSGRRKRTAEVTGIAERAIRQAAEMVGHGEDQLPDARPRHRAAQPRRAERARRDQHRAGVGADRPRRAAATRRSPARATARAGASTARSATSSPAAATSRTPSTAPTSPASGASTEQELPGAGVDAYEIFRKIDAGEIKGLLSICFNPVVSLPDSNFIRRMLEKLEFYVAIDFFLSETARYADVVLPGSLHEEDEGIVTHDRGAGHQDQQGGRLPRRGAAGLADHPGHRQGARPRRRASRSTARARSSRSCGVASKGGVADYSGITYEKIERQHGRLLAVPERSRSPRHAAAVRAGVVEPGREGGRAVLLPRRQGPLQRRPLHAADRGRGRRVPGDPDHRPGGEPVPLRQPDPADRPAGRSVPGAAHRAAPAAGRAARASPTATGSTVEIAPRAAARCARQVVTTIRPDTVFIPYHWAGAKSVNQLTIAAQDPISKIPEYKVCAVRVRKAAERRSTRASWSRSSSRQPLAISITVTVAIGEHSLKIDAN